jgi:hypothetical protein
VPRCIPGCSETVNSYCEGTTSTAERIRHAATITVPGPVWSPALTAESLSNAAACSTVISHNCEILLRTLATRVDQQGFDAVVGQLLGIAEAAGQGPRRPSRVPPGSGTGSPPTPAAPSHPSPAKPPT